jgi:hypothetical protein
MSASAPALPPTSAAPATAAPAKPLTAIQVVEQEIANFLRQEEATVSQLHAVKGAIQAGNFLLQRLKSEEQKAVAFAKAEFEKAQAAAAPVVAEVEAEAKKVESAVESAL